MKKLFFLFVMAVCFFSIVTAQNTKKPVDFTLYDSWKSLSSQQVSDDGNWLAWTINPLNGDGRLFVRAWSENTEKRVLTAVRSLIFHLVQII